MCIQSIGEVMKYHLVSISSDIVEDNYEEGEGDSTGCGYQGEKIGETFPDMESMVKYLSTHYGLSEQLVDYNIEDRHLETSRLCANHSEAQNGGWFEPTKQEIDLWTQNQMKLYSENYTVNYLKGSF